MPRPVVVLDACVLYSAPVRHLMLHAAVEQIFSPRWTDAIHREWIEALLANRSDLDRSKLERTRSLMDRAIPDCLVTQYEHLVGSLQLPDPNDAHVLAAAIQAGAQSIVTFNIGDFPTQALSAYGVTSVHPDDFLSRLGELDPTNLCRAAQTHRASLHQPSKTVEEYLETLERHSMTRTAAVLRQFRDQI